MATTLRLRTSQSHGIKTSSIIVHYQDNSLTITMRLLPLIERQLLATALIGIVSAFFNIHGQLPNEKEVWGRIDMTLGGIYNLFPNGSLDQVDWRSVRTYCANRAR